MLETVVVAGAWAFACCTAFSKEGGPLAVIFGALVATVLTLRVLQ